MWRKRKGIEPSVPPLARSTIGFEDRGRHQFGTRFRRRGYTDFGARERGRAIATARDGARSERTRGDENVDRPRRSMY